MAPLFITQVRNSSGLGAGASVTSTGLTIFLSLNGSTEVTLYNSGANPIYVGVNGIITGATVVNPSNVPPSVGFPTLTAAEALATGLQLLPYASSNVASIVKFKGYTPLTGRYTIRNIWAITGATLTSTLCGGETAFS